MLYEGKPVGTPDAGAFWRVIADHKVKALFTAPTAFRAIKKEDPTGQLLKNYDISTFKISVSGRRADRSRYPAMGRGQLKVPVIDHWWQTETGWPIASNCMGLACLRCKPGSPTKAGARLEVQALLEDGVTRVPRGEIGAICVKLPMPPSRLLTLWNADHRYHRQLSGRISGLLQNRRCRYM